MPENPVVHSPRIARLRLGDGDAAATSYLPERHWPGARASDVVAADGFGLRLAGDPPVLEFSSPAGAVWLRLALASVDTGHGVRLRFELGGDQHFYGLGEGGQQFDRLGATRRLWNSQANHGPGADVAIPLLLSSAGWGLFFDNSSRAQIVLGDSVGGAGIEYVCEAGPLDLYFLGGGDLRAVLGAAADLLGHATMPPRWALGYLQSTRHFDSAEELRALPKTFREKRLPCDAIIFLSTYPPARGWNRAVGHLEWEPGLFADLAGTLAEFSSRDFRVVSHEYPVLHEDSPLHAEAEAMGALLDHAYPRTGPGTEAAPAYREGQRFIDFSRDDVRSWWWDRHRDLIALGVAGWWLDGGEGPPAATRLQGGPGVALHNRFDLLRQQCFAEGEARDRPEHRPFLLCRSGGPGMQRFGAIPWSGDIDCTFATLEMQVAIGLNLALSGVPFWGTDIGGFYEIAGADQELFVRWFQFGAFCPLFRGHGHTWRHHLPWSYGAEVEAICRSYLELRSRLMPYTYTLAWQAHRSGLPMMRPLVLNNPHDARTWQLGTEYTWGDSLLVAPVTRAGATQWPVYFPAGVWHDFWTGEAHAGPGAATVAAPLDRLPLFVRAGSIVPLGPVRQHDRDRGSEEITLLIHPAGASSFTLYEDDGETNGYAAGRHVMTEFTCTQDQTGCTVTIGRPQGEAALLPQGRSYTLQISCPSTPRSVTLDGAPMTDWRHDGDRFLFIRLGGGAATVRIERASTT